MLAQQIKEELNSFKMVCISNSTKVNPALTPLSGDGSPRVVQTSHTFLLMIMHPLLDMASWRIPSNLSTWELERTAFTS